MANDDSSYGVAAAVTAAAWMSHTLGLEVLSFGRPAVSKHYACKLELTGRFLLYDITLDHDWLNFSVALLDRADPPEELFHVADGPQGWQDVCRVVAAMERSGLRSLVRPFHVGSESGPNSFQFC
jgi:hypothetical protein